MLLAVNIGNSNIRFAVVDGQEVHLSWTIPLSLIVLRVNFT